MTRLDKLVVAVFVLAAVVMSVLSRAPSPDGASRRPLPPAAEAPVRPAIAERARRPSLPPSAANDPVLSVEDTGIARNKTGTAFAMDAHGTWFTARHVVNGCAHLFIDTPGARAPARVAMAHPSADFAVIEADRPGTPSSLVANTPTLHEDAFAFGYPQGQLGAAHGQLLGRARMVTQGGFSGMTPTLTWADVGRVPELDSLGGMSGGPMVDEDGTIIGVMVAESARRGRIYSVAPELLREAAERFMAAAPAAVSFRDVALDPAALARNAQRARETARIARVVCFAS